MTRYMRPRLNNIRREWDLEHTKTIVTHQSETCNVCREAIPIGTEVAHRVWTSRVAHVDCAATRPTNWWQDVTAACVDCRASFPLHELIVEDASVDPNLQVRRCVGCVRGKEGAA